LLLTQGFQLAHHRRRGFDVREERQVPYQILLLAPNVGKHPVHGYQVSLGGVFGSHPLKLMRDNRRLRQDLPDMHPHRAINLVRLN
jgi:hypothetical protein